jgi:hypothetical protein
LCLGIGGGGDVVGALASALLAGSLGTSWVVGGVSWERRVVDPGPGPRRLDELSGATALNQVVALAGPDTRGPGGFHFAESRMAAVLDERTVLVDPTPGPDRVGRGLADAAGRLDCDLVVLVDVGGDVLAHGHEPHLASPLCDAVMLAAAQPLGDAGVPVVGAVFGPGCDGELSPAEVLERLAELGAAGALLGTWGITPQAAEALSAAVAVIPTEASAQALRCFAGERGTAAIRGGRRQVELSPLGALTFYFDPLVALRTAVPLARAVAGSADLLEANRRLLALGVNTELELEREAAGPA